jgi:hypothetical protein
MTGRFITISTNLLICSYWFGLSGASQAMAQGSLTITAPVASVKLSHSGSDGDLTFADQRWDVKANANNGATVIFSTERAFTHTADSSFQRDASLRLSLASSSGPAKWKLVVASDQTHYAARDGVAAVQAVSDRNGRAEFDLTVTFVTDAYDTLAEGDYALTVTGTLTGN